MIDWSKGFSASYVLAIVDPLTWADRSEMEFTDGSIDRDSTADLLESASITVTDDSLSGEKWVRVYLLAKQGGSAERIPLFTGITSAPERELDGIRETWKAECYSALKPADDVLLARGYYAPAGSSADLVKDLLSVSPAPFSVSGSPPALSSDIVAESGESRLSLAKKVVDAIGWQLSIHGDGSIHLMEPGASPAERFGVEKNDVLEPDVKDKTDWYNCPNVFRAVDDDAGTAVARDDDPDSKFSTASRGREIWMEDSSVELSGNETIAEYAVRRLKEEQTPAREISYNRRFFPGVRVGDIVALDYPRHKLSGNFRVAKQTLELSYGCKTAETVNEV